MIRAARPDDVPAILGLVRELAAYERALSSVVATEAGFLEALFGPTPAAYCHVAEEDGEVVGFALWFLNFSTWLGRHGIYLEDLYVRPSHRGRGLGRALLATLASVAAARGYGRVEWSVLDWNEPAQAFYRSLGAEPMHEWTVWRLTGDALVALGCSGAPVAPDERPVVSLALDRDLAVLVGYPTGVVYRQQYGGTACLAAQVEGYLVPLAPPDDVVRGLRALFEGELGGGGLRGGSLSVEQLSRLRALVSSLAHDRSVAAVESAPLALDETRLAALDEAFVPVVTLDGPGWLVWANSD